jgi:hypothetical protein
MASTLFKLGADEEKRAEYFFKRHGDFGNSGLVTNRRLIVITKNAVETYPLAKINAVRIGYSRSLVTVALGIVMVIVAVSGWMALSHLTNTLATSAQSVSSYDVLSQAKQLLQHASWVQFGMLPLLLYGAYVSYVGWRGTTAMIVSIQGGEKSYHVSGKDHALLNFVDTLTHLL